MLGIRKLSFELAFRLPGVLKERKRTYLLSILYQKSKCLKLYVECITICVLLKHTYTFI